MILEKLLEDLLQIQSKVMFEVLNDPGNRSQRQRISDILRPWSYLKYMRIKFEENAKKASQNTNTNILELTSKLCIKKQDNLKMAFGWLVHLEEKFDP